MKTAFNLICFLLCCFGMLHAQSADPSVSGAGFTPNNIKTGETATLTVSFANTGFTAIPSQTIEVTINTASAYYSTDGVTKPSGNAGDMFDWEYLGKDTWRGKNNVAIDAFDGGDITLEVLGTDASPNFETTIVNVQPVSRFNMFTNEASNDNLAPTLKVEQGTVVVDPCDCGLDKAAPALSNVPSDVSIDCDAAMPTGTGVTAVDACDNNVSISFNDVETTAVNEGDRIVTRTWTATDNCGNAATATQVITIICEDVVDPCTDCTTEIINCPNNIVVEVEAGVTQTEVSYTTPTIDATCTNASIQLKKGYASNSFFPLGTTQITYEATDDCGNTAICSFTVTVEEKEEVIVEPIGDNAEPALSSASFSPNRIAEGETSTLTVSFANSGSTAIPAASIELTISTANTYYTTDGTTAPVGNGADLFTWTYLGADTWRGKNAVAINAYDGGNIELTVTGLAASANFEATTVNVQPVSQFAAFSNNTSNDNLTPALKIDAATVDPCDCKVDKTGPALANIPSNVTIDCDDTIPNGTGVKATDSCDDNVSISFLDKETPKVGGQAGEKTIERTWTATDKCGNTSTATQIITIACADPCADCETTAPSCPNDITVNADYAQSAVAVTYTTPSATSNCTGYSVTLKEGKASGALFSVGKTKVQYEITDDCGYSYTCTFYVTVNAFQANCTNFNATAKTTDTKCGDTSGSITLTVSGGEAPYVYKWNDGVSTKNRTNLKAGTYGVIVTDAHGCSKTLSVTVTDNTGSCNPSSDCDDITVTGGKGTITITGMTAAVNKIQVFDKNWKQVFNCNYCKETEIAKDLAAGTYRVYAYHFDKDWRLICDKKITITIEGGDSACANVGKSCDDGDECTINDKYDANCDCVGAVKDMNGNNIPDCDEPAPCEITIKATNIKCDDNGTAGDKTDDTFTFDLTITGGTGWGYSLNGSRKFSQGFTSATINLGPFPISEGAQTFTVTDYDNPDCKDDITVTPPNTCSTGTTTPTLTCDDVQFTGGAGTLTVSGLKAAVNKLQVFNNKWQQVYTCDYGCKETEVLSLPAGTYLVYVKYYDKDWKLICGKNDNITVTEGTPVCNDDDNDGVCNEDDVCPGKDDNADANNNGIADCQETHDEPSCDNITVKDVNGKLTITGLTAAINTVHVFDANWKLVHKCDYDCEATEAIDLAKGNYYVYIKLYKEGWEKICQTGRLKVEISEGTTPTTCAKVGKSCDDGDECTTNDKYDADCNCVGTVSDSDNDGVCDALDICDGPDDANNNNIPDCQEGNTPSCDDITIKTSNMQVVIGGLTAPNTTIYLFNSKWWLVDKCSYNCANNTTFDVSATGTYYLLVKFYDSTYDKICEKAVAIKVTRNTNEETNVVSSRSIDPSEINAAIDFEETASLDFSVYPNPANSIAHLALTQQINQATSIRISDHTGRIVAVQDFDQIAEPVQLDLTKLSSGLYIIQLQTNGQQITKKLVINKL